MCVFYLQFRVVHLVRLVWRSGPPWRLRPSDVRRDDVPRRRGRVVRAMGTAWGDVATAMLMVDVSSEFSKDLFDDDATPFPSYHAPRKRWQAEKPFQCACKQGWTGGDCSLMLCPRAPAWFSYPSRDDKAHDALQECAGMGVCDRTTGMCMCPPHLTGAACERLQCPGADISGGFPCNGVGRCMSMRELALRGDTTEGSPAHHLPFPGLDYGFAYGSDNDNGLTWDADRMYGCVCDEGYSGYDCTEKACPTGDDPGTRDQLNELQSIACKYTSSSTDFAGRFQLDFSGAVDGLVTL